MNAILPHLSGLSRDNTLLAGLTMIVTRADDLEMLSGQAHVPAEQVRIDAQRIRTVADQLRRLLVQAHTVVERVQ